MKFTTRFGKTIEIPIEKFLSMTDEELEILEESEGTSIFFENFKDLSSETFPSSELDKEE